MTDVALLPPVGSKRAPGPVRAGAAGERLVVRLATFGAFGLYGVLRWATLLSPRPTLRLLALLALGVVLAGGGAIAVRRSRLLGIVIAVIAVLAALAIAGLPLAWIVHLRIAVSASAIGRGLSALPGALVPYLGGDEWLRVVIVLGAAVLLLDSALLLAFAPESLGDVRRAVAALPLVALAVIPSTLVRPQFPYLDGLVLFALLAAFLWGERIERAQVGSALGLCAIAGVAAMLGAPRIDPGAPLIDYRALGAVAPAALDTFNWAQGYGPIDWPRRGRTVLEITASHADYWKAEDLDVFDGRGWSQGAVAGAGALAPGPPAALREWSQTIDVTIRDMSTTDVIGSGFSQQPVQIAQPLVPGASPGTWATGTALGPGSRYVVRVYSPRPSAARLSAARPDYAGVPLGYRTILLPVGPDSQSGPGQPEVVFPPFHSSGQVQNVIGLPVGTGLNLLDASPYRRAYALARRLSGTAATPYAYAIAIERFLAHGYTYTEQPPSSRYPLETFLFTSKRGYCQQFAGAMALLLRMGGVPARVAAGFTPGTYDRATRRWVVTDVDAHAWVEAWFRGYGWVPFDPTPSVPAVFGNRAAGGAVSLGTAPALDVRTHSRSDLRGPVAARTARTRAVSGTSGVGAVELVALALAAGALLIGLARATRPAGSEEGLIAELERAFVRTGRPLAAATTLAALEHRLRGSPDAAGYVRALRLRRFGSASAAPSPRQRRALRAELRAGLGLLGRLRALWALPPRRH